MSIQLIQKYYTEVDKIKRYSGASNESSLRKPFQDLLEAMRVCTVSVETMKIVREMPE
jgi:hypothetical protein